MAEKPPSRAFFVFLVVVVLVAAGIGSYFLYQHNYPRPASTGPKVAVGDNVTVNYIGWFGSGPEANRVFDTSLRAAADNNASYPKSLEYTPRNASGYTPLGVHVGGNTPGSGYQIGNVTYGGVVTGFWKGLVGLGIGQTGLISIPPNLGYGTTNTSCLRSLPLVQNVSSVQVLPLVSFARAYPGVVPFAGVTFSDPTYGWTDTVLSSNDSTVVVELLPSVGTTTFFPGWGVEVTAVSGGTITLVNLLSSANAGLVLGKLTGASVCGSSQFIVSAVNPNGTFTENFNREVVGQTLVFQVTVVTIYGATNSTGGGGGGYY